jgi:hypothetical protein
MADVRWLWIVVLATGCATTPTVAPTFTYAPRTGTHYVRTVKVVNETSVLGSPFRQREEQEFVWNVAFTRQGDLTLVTHQLQRLTVRVNDAEVLGGERAAREALSVDLLVSSEPRVLEVRGAERAAQILSSLAPAASGPVIEPDQVREIAVALFEMAVRDVVGHPTAAGSTWVASDPDPAVDRKTMSVDRLEPCGVARCARVTARYQMSSRGAVRAMRSAQAFLERSGVNPAETEVLDSELDYHEELLLEPGTLVDHGARFSRITRVTFAGPQGTSIPVEFRATLEQSSTFP